MKIRRREKIPPTKLNPNDEIELAVDGKVVCTEKIGRAMTVDEVVVFDVEPGEFGEHVTDGIGGAFLETKKGAK